MTGRKPKPRALKELAGTDQPCRRNPREPKPSAGAKCPSHLPVAARRVWQRLAPELVQLGVLKRCDVDAFAGYCKAVTDFYHAARVVEREGVTAPGANGGVVRHPAILVQNQAMQLIRQFASEFGLTPSSRTRIHADPEGPSADKPAEKAKRFKFPRPA